MERDHIPDMYSLIDTKLFEMSNHIETMRMYLTEIVDLEDVIYKVLKAEDELSTALLLLSQKFQEFVLVEDSEGEER